MPKVTIDDITIDVPAGTTILEAARMIGEQQLAEQAAQLESAARLKQLSELELLTQGVEEQMNNIERDMGLWLDE